MTTGLVSAARACPISASTEPLEPGARPDLQGQEQRHFGVVDSLSSKPCSRYVAAVASSSCEHWSLSRSLAFLAAIFAIMLGTLLPSAVAASAATGSPIMLCSGDQIMVVYDADGVPQPDTPSPMDSLKCASCVLANFTALPPPPPIHPVAPPRIAAVQPTALWASLPADDFRTGLRPPSTAPPTT